MRVRLLIGLALLVTLGAIALVNLPSRRPILTIQSVPVTDFASQGPIHDQPCPDGPCGPDAPGQPTPATPVESSTPSPSPSPSGGLSEDQAVAIAREHSGLPGLVSGSVTRSPAEYHGPGFIVTQNELVWVVMVTGEMTICGGPPQDVCLSPRPGFSTVYLDYFTGRFIGNESYSPAN